ncbi:hypothetical protein [Nonomuraea dietziae]|uniref:hypothetical protein n=1 Tax=Nonomuraea dietziae TaxID=65515 RepID=UPI0031CF79C9
MRPLTTFAALLGTLALTGCAGGSGEAPAADVTAKPEFSGTLSILTEVRGRPVEPVLREAGGGYEKKTHPVKIELYPGDGARASRTSRMTLTASDALPDNLLHLDGQLGGELYVRGGRAGDLPR